MNALNPTDLAKMPAHEVCGVADLDFYAVRDEGFRRQTAAEKKIAKLRAQLAKAEKEMADAHAIINAALREQAIAA